MAAASASGREANLNAGSYVKLLLIVNRFATYLQKHLDGEVLVGEEAREHFATDASPLSIMPKIVVYPRHESDVCKVLSWCDQFATKGVKMPVTVRGGGTDLAGASVGPGVILALNSHLNSLLEFESRRGLFRLQAGCDLGQWHQFLASQYRFFPPTKGAAPGATIGGAIANNSGSHYSEKYGPTNRYIRRLRVVLSNGEAITAERLTRRQTLRKLNQSDLEGEIYRQLIQFWPRYDEQISHLPDNYHVGYDLRGVRLPDGGYNLIPLLAGSQGTLGVVTEAEIATRPFNPVPLAALLTCPNFKDLVALVFEIKKQHPASIEMFDRGALKTIDKLAPGFLAGYELNLPKTAAVLLVEFDDHSYRRIWRKLKRVAKKARYYGVDCRVMSSFVQQQQVERLRQATSFILTDVAASGSRPVMGFEDVQLPLEQFEDFYRQAAEMFRKSRLNFAAWGNIGLGQLRLAPKLNLDEAAGRRRYLKLLESYLKLARQHGGQSNTFNNDGRLRGAYLKSELEPDLYEIQLEIKNLFDPSGLLNPGVKFGADKADNLKHLKHQRGWGRFYQQLPRL